MRQARRSTLLQSSSGIGRFLIVAALGIATGCAAPPPAPDVIVFQWMQAFAAQDGNAVAKLTCRASQADSQNARLLTMALGVTPPNFGGAGGGQFFGGGGGGQVVYDVSGLRYETTFADDRNARVQVTGSLRMVNGLATQVLRTNSTVGLTREQDVWRVCDTPA
jgi:hypothetical protein